AREKQKTSTSHLRAIPTREKSIIGNEPFWFLSLRYPYVGVHWHDLQKNLFQTEEIPFVMELPPYRMPILNNTLKDMWYKASQYVEKMGNHSGGI
ncbi:MAG: hypothetical protein KGY69_13705, partial [Bacteroidales bacterium]|nr:hypothetical protein [Bacteroidales bacterium]